jgi:hypothetical protein
MISRVSSWKWLATASARPRYLSLFSCPDGRTSLVDYVEKLETYNLAQAHTYFKFFIDASPREIPVSR